MLDASEAIVSNSDYMKVGKYYMKKEIYSFCFKSHLSSPASV